MYGALGRNTGEVIGVFGDIAIKKNPGLGGYTSSVKVKTLDDMEAQLAKLQPPRWPAAFGAIDTKLADTGGQLFAKDCAGCHTVPTKPQGDLTEKFKVTLQPVFPVAGTNQHGSGTDFWMACNAVLDSASSGLFTGNKTQVVAGAPIQDPAANLVLLTNAVTGVLANNKWEVAKSGDFPFSRGCLRRCRSIVRPGLIRRRPGPGVHELQGRSGRSEDGLQRPAATGNLGDRTVPA